MHPVSVIGKVIIKLLHEDIKDRIFNKKSKVIIKKKEKERIFSTQKVVVISGMHWRIAQGISSSTA